jgi:hypothetical protein
MASKAIIVSADNIKESLSGYTPAKLGEFHRESTRLADKAYHDTIKSSRYSRVVLLSGGSASGKTEYMSAYLQNQSVIILDGTLPTLEGFEIKRRNALRLNKKVEIHAIIPEEEIANIVWHEKD